MYGRVVEHTHKLKSNKVIRLAGDTTFQPAPWCVCVFLSQPHGGGVCVCPSASPMVCVCVCVCVFLSQPHGVTPESPISIVFLSIFSVKGLFTAGLTSGPEAHRAQSPVWTSGPEAHRVHHPEVSTHVTCLSVHHVTCLSDHHVTCLLAHCTVFNFR